MARVARSIPRFSRTVLLCAPLVVLACLQSGCQGCWSVDSGRCGPGIEFDGCADGDAALFIGALYLALAIPYLIAEACRSCR